MATLKVVRVHEYGGPEVLRYEDAPVPEPAEGDVAHELSRTGHARGKFVLQAG